MLRNNNKVVVLCLLALYMYLVCSLTIINRPISISTPQFRLFWSYRGWFNGNWNLGKQIIFNVAMFIPFGFFVAALSPKRHFIITFCASLFFSLVIEIHQFYFCRGLFEIDDILNNVIGGIIGLLVFWMLEKIIPKYVYLIGAVFIAISIFFTGSIDDSVNIPNMLCFQIDSTEEKKISGFAFLYKRESNDFLIKLRSQSGEILIAQTTYHIERKDVDQYFFCEQDYSHTGFQAIINDMDPDEEYEIIVSFDRFINIPTGVYITGDRIHYIKDAEFKEPDIDIAKKGVLRAYNSDYHYWVYQMNGSLYWIVDQDFDFEKDGSTYIQYQLWTTQIDNLPQYRLNNEWFWDNISGNFEDYEVQGDYAGYRVMKREMPAEYPITSIETGYYKDGKWIWKVFFRPYYEF